MPKFNHAHETSGSTECPKLIAMYFLEIWIQFNKFERNTTMFGDHLSIIWIEDDVQGFSIFSFKRSLKGAIKRIWATW
jgi:hypothetical protein